ncbi:tyrosine-type recombinase/integrase [Hathewaya massiliensis]|uniref:tyrosine-type recombinase/integrase n=1 Tax=Hathewaya massiliensis TaxID=1964382 RepID=UPI00115B2E4B|nr:tyrosine-type recombinase/integrase [Hathewaya massiliensis]
MRKQTVQPIRDIETVLDISDYLQDKNIRDCVLFNFGIYTGFRISDILKLKVRDVKEFLETNTIDIVEQKTNKERIIELNPALREILKDYIEGKSDYEYLFQSRKKTSGIYKPITREHAGRILKNAGKKFGIRRINTHTMRKTFGYFLYKQTGDIVQVREALNHSDISVTKRYIGLTEKMINDSIVALNFGRRKRK